ncbi:hypothetical protein Q5P01_010900 [Channa striata]|uniref:FXYD domain-containing ion transport regulator n=1 Tax=Channa striata TaxID=64152 RepID=A0AA88SNM2_CHASR|nr:hypothetical protein Q5P01_010900 [Channa striata]
MEEKRKRCHFCLLLLALLLTTTPSSAQNTTLTPATTVMTSTANPATVGYSTRPADITVAEGQSAVFHCGVPTSSPNLTFTYYGKQQTYILTCPYSFVELVPQTLYGSCEIRNGESLAVWTLSAATFYDNGTTVVCHQSNNPDAPAAVLRVYIKGNNYTTLIGCTIGGFFVTALVFVLLYFILQRSESFQRCFRGKETEDDLNTINVRTLSSAPGPVSSVMLKMGHLTLVAVMAVLFALFVEAEANPFVYNYERLRIGGLVCTGLLVAGGVSVLLYKRCPKKSRKAEDDSSTI